MQRIIEHVVHHPGIAALGSPRDCADGIRAEKSVGIGPARRDQNGGRFVT